ncbi:ABC transporter ATP-binding protein [Mobiluncus curtisii]|uniref:ABC transporter ATP-binding protein n=1 Tax=Mobiluncus curtisii TaxID=2051 RepID=UPI00146FF358|nr:ABC transporter ATP-binding protein [Mobiluncus curtisii]NMW46247.1 ABC transporter ATP-binding protein [Mobiluncus curtisii]
MKKMSVADLIKPARTSMIVSGMLTACGAILGIMPYISLHQMALIWLHGVTRDGLTGNIWFWAASAFISLFIGQSLYVAGLGVTHLSEAKLRHKMRQQVVDALANLPLGQVNAYSRGQIRKMVCDDTAAVHTMVAHLPGDATNAVVSLVAGFGYLLWVDWRVCLVLFGIWIAVILLIYVLNMRGYGDLTAHFGEAQTGLANATVEMLEGIKEIKNFQAVDATKTKFNEAREKFSSISYSWVSQSGKAVSSVSALLRPAVIFVTVALLTVIFVKNGWMQIADTLPFFLIAPGVPDGLATLIGLSQHLYEARLAAQSTVKLLSLEPMKFGSQTAGDASDVGRVEMRNVTFSYEPDTPAVKEVSFTAQPGTVTALVGPSGGGKSTLAKLIARFYEADSGTVLVNGVDVRDASNTLLLGSVAIMLQDVALAHDSVFNNIALAKPDASLSEVEAAAKAACIHERIMQLPNGYDTILGDEGGFLSGGEKQRVALARAYLQDASILILDEATAQADPRSEQQIHEALAKLTTGKTVIVIAHRLATIRNVDQILVIEDGQIVERGCHDELMEKDGRYATMWRTQMVR